MHIDIIPLRKLQKLAAASGIVRVKNNFYVVADDELSLGILPVRGKLTGILLPLFSGRLPSGKKSRKKKKPDWEALVYLGKKFFPPGGAILAVPSGSEPNRVRGALVFLQGEKKKSARIQHVDFSELYAKLRESLPELNIEGAIVQGRKLRLFQRGNGKGGKNAVIDLSLSGILKNLIEQRPLGKKNIKRISHIRLGKLSGIPLSFTDAAIAANGKIWFLAVAENTKSTYLDGEFRGAVLGQLKSNGSIGKLIKLNIPAKPEGICFGNRKKSGQEFFVVTDADDRSRPSVLYRGMISKELCK